ncbi:beta-N-acetylhexosaminidase [Streptomyces sp. NPDC046909]|uniref:beta-N-acetylhexosaminidase n=1 Tax=Streptomyces sp. NPDC046909 TaxID=3155617 RepID=UPI0033FB8746
MIPHPSRLSYGTGSFALTARTAVIADAATERAAAWLESTLTRSLGRRTPDGGPAVRLTGAEGLGDEGYRLHVSPDGVLIEASAHAGAFYGCQSLVQLLPPQIHRAAAPDRPDAYEIPSLTIEDRPRFRWRGVLIDVARRFLPQRELLRYVDLLALHKLNTLHLHLTDDQGWRIESERHPRLTEVGAWRRESTVGSSIRGHLDGRPHGGFYTKADLRELVAYAADRAVTVVPGIDLPGHTQAAIAAYPELGNLGRPIEVATAWGPSEHVLNAEESTVRFFLDVLDEVMEVFPSPYLHIGGDECVRRQWKASARVRERIRELGLCDEDALQGWFIGRLAAHLAAHGRKLVGWDEILQGGLAEGATVMSWRGMRGAIEAARAGHDVIATPLTHTYFDFRQSEHPDEPIPLGCVTSLRDAYAFDPVPEELDAEAARHVLGGQAQLWGEPLDGPRSLDYLAFPRLCAFAEAVWGQGPRAYEEFAARLVPHLERLDALGVEYRPLDGPRPWQSRPDAKGWKRDREAVLADVLGGPEHAH